MGALVHDDVGRLLLVRRKNPPAAGLWSVPGGRVEAGEDDSTALAREVAEETGLEVSVGGMLGEVLRDGPDDVTFVIRDYACRAVGGHLTPGDDATDARWVDPADLDSLDLVPLLRETLESWGVLHG